MKKLIAVILLSLPFLSFSMINSSQEIRRGGGSIYELCVTLKEQSRDFIAFCESDKASKKAKDQIELIKRIVRDEPFGQKSILPEQQGYLTSFEWNGDNFSIITSDYSYQPVEFYISAPVYKNEQYD